MGLSSDIRQLAGLVIKNYAFQHLPKLPPTVQQLVKQEMLHALSDALTDIRNTAAILVGKISESFAINTWADLLAPLLNMLEYGQHGQLVVVDGALQAVKRMCEDSADKLSMDTVRRPLDSLLPKLIALLACPEEVIKLRALETITSTLFLFTPPQQSPRSKLSNPAAGACMSPSSSYNSLSSNGSLAAAGRGAMAYPSPTTSPTMGGQTHKGGGDSPSPPTVGAAVGCGAQALAANMTAFLQGLAALSADPSPKVRRAVCQAIVLLATLQLSVLEPLFASICEFLLKSILDVDEGVAMEACEFWSVLSDNTDAHAVVRTHMPMLIPHLISRLTLTQEQIMLERIEEEAQASGEQEINFKPIHRRGSGGKGDEDDEEEASAKWTLRKQAALVLDNLAVTFSAAAVLPHALPAIQLKLQAPVAAAPSSSSHVPGPEDGVWERESGMLALGALSTGCLKEMGQYLPQLFPFLVQNLGEPTPEMRSIACWVLSRYCTWIFDDAQVLSEGSSERYFTQMLEALLQIMLDPRPKVQAACCSALCTLVEVAGPDPVLPYLPQIFTHVQGAFALYGVKSSLILIDTIGTLADTVGDALCDPALVPLFLPVLMAKFGELEDVDMRLFPVMECLMSVVAVLGLEMQPYAQNLYYRCLRIIGNTMTANAQADVKAQMHMASLAAHSDDPTSVTSSTSSGLNPAAAGYHESDDDAPSKDFAICALDVISALCEGLEANFATLADSTRDVLLQLAFTCLRDGLPELRQSAFALTGDLCKSCVSFVAPAALPQLMEAVLLNIQDREPGHWHPMVCNNASWTVGELAIKVGGEVMAPYVARLMQAFIQLLTHDKDSVGLGGVPSPSGAVPPTLLENIAVTVGRLGLTNTSQLAEYLPEFLEAWCMALRFTRASEEKDQAFAGLVALVNANPQALVNPADAGKGRVAFAHAFFLACGSWEDPPEDDVLLQQLGQMLGATKSSNEGAWRAMLAVVDRDVAHRTLDMFRVSA